MPRGKRGGKRGGARSTKFPMRQSTKNGIRTRPKVVDPATVTRGSNGAWIVPGFDEPFYSVYRKKDHCVRSYCAALKICKHLYYCPCRAKVRPCKHIMGVALIDKDKRGPRPSQEEICKMRILELQNEFSVLTSRLHEMNLSSLDTLHLEVKGLLRSTEVLLGLPHLNDSSSGEDSKLKDSEQYDQYNNEEEEDDVAFLSD